MSNYSRIIANEIAKRNEAVIVRKPIGKLNPIKEWVKWLSYETEYEKERKQIVYSKTGKDLTIDELSELNVFKYRNYMKELLIKYENKECTKEEYMTVYDYLGGSITDLMLDKLSADELEYAETQIAVISSSKEEVLEKLINLECSIYDELTMVDAYILHMLIYMQHTKGLNELDKVMHTSLTIQRY